MALYLFFIFIGLGAVYGFLIGYRNEPRKEKMTVLKINSHEFNVEIANDPISQARGLAGRNSLPENQGMLFLFSDKTTRNFWMAGMRFPLDIIWIDGGTIIGIAENIPPASNRNFLIYTSPSPADKVLEINAGLAGKLGIKIGDLVIFSEVQR